LSDRFWRSVIVYLFFLALAIWLIWLVAIRL